MFSDIMAATALSAADPTAAKPILMVVLLGVGMVFVGLISIIVICKLMGVLFGALSKKQPAPAAPTKEPQPMENRQEIIAAVSAAIAEELGKEVSALKIISFKKL